MNDLNFIDLFAGAGGLSEGFISEGFKPVAHVEMDEAACYSLRTRTACHYLKSVNKYDKYTSYLKGEISRSELYACVPEECLDSVINLAINGINNRKIHSKIQKQLNGRKVDLIIGGPPCQAYSLAGRARCENGMKGDRRNYLYVQYAKYLEKYQPRLFVFENVPGLQSAKNGMYLNNMQKLFLKKGYGMKLFTVEANNFGVLQKRKRIIIIGWKDDFAPNIPDLEEIRTPGDFKVKYVFSDLPRIKAGEGIDKFSGYMSESNEYLSRFSIRNGLQVLTQHVARPQTDQDRHIYHIAVQKWKEEGKRLNYNDLPENLKTHKNRHSFHDRFKVVADELDFAHTVAAHIEKDGHYYIHPDIEQNRSISVREAARLQSFPDDYYFEGVKEGINRTPALRQIGNAVPPLMAREVARQILNIFLSL